jgi:hypothetical protein
VARAALARERSAPHLRSFLPRTCLLLASSPLPLSVHSLCVRQREWTVWTGSRAGCRRLVLAATHAACMAATSMENGGTALHQTVRAEGRQGKASPPENLLPALSAKLLLSMNAQASLRRSASNPTEQSSERTFELIATLVCYLFRNERHIFPSRPSTSRRPACSDGKGSARVHEGACQRAPHPLRPHRLSMRSESAFRRRSCARGGERSSSPQRPEEANNATGGSRGTGRRQKQNE